MANTLIIRTDANLNIGTGHFMRCLAIAQNWRDIGGKTSFVMANASLEIEKHIQKENLFLDSISTDPGSREDALITVEIVLNKNASWVVIDGYHFKSEYQKIIKDGGLYILFIDDYGHSDYYFADIILNQNIYADEYIYSSRESYTKLLLGSEYILLREEFKKWNTKKRNTSSRTNKILVTLGGSDPENQTLKVINALNMIGNDKLNIKIVLGAVNPHLKALESAISKSHHNMTLHKNVTTMPELMAWADIAVTNGGSTCWETAYMALPNIIIVLADNQKYIAEGLSKDGIAINLGWYEQLSADHISKALINLISDQNTRENMSRRGKLLIDGKGSERVIGNIIC